MQKWDWAFRTLEKRILVSLFLQKSDVTFCRMNTLSSYHENMKYALAVHALPVLVLFNCNMSLAPLKQSFQLLLWEVAELYEEWKS